MKILVKFPIRTRLEKFLNTLELYLSKASNVDDMFFQIDIDEDDEVMNNFGTFARIGCLFARYGKKKTGYEIYSICVSNSETKIQAINSNFPDLNPKYNIESDCDILLLASDDMIPIVQGYDDIIRNAMKQYYPDTDGVLWFFDGQRKDLNTLVIAGYKYLSRFFTMVNGYKRYYIYHPSYLSLWADNEFHIVAEKLNRQTFIEQVIISHEHEVWKLGNTPDTLMTLNNSYGGKDNLTFENRKKINFDLVNQK